jgi:hypothetical protein
MDETAEDLVRRLHHEEVERVRREGASIQPPAGPASIPCTDLPPARTDSPLFAEWNAYRREVGRLLAEGRQGQFVLIKAERIVALFPAEREALDHGHRLFPNQPFLVHQVRAKKPLLRCVSVRLWPN